MTTRDETPTPKQSGSFAMMQGACEETLRSLVVWRVRAAGSPRSDEVVVFESKFRALLEEVKSWADVVPTPESKALTIKSIFDARDEASRWGARWGWTL